MEPVSLGVVVSALILKAAEKTGEQGADAGWSAVRRLVERIHRRFRNDAASSAALARVEDPPAGWRHLEALAAAVDKHAAADGEFAAELSRLVEEATAGGVQVQRPVQNVIAAAPWSTAQGAMFGNIINKCGGVPRAGHSQAAGGHTDEEATGNPR